MVKKFLFMTLFFSAIYAQAEMSDNIADCPDLSGSYFTNDTEVQTKEMKIAVTKEPSAVTYDLGNLGQIVADSAKHTLNGLDYTTTCSKGFLRIEFVVYILKQELKTVITYKQSNTNGDILNTLDTDTTHDTINWIKQ